MGQRRREAAAALDQIWSFTSSSVNVRSRWNLPIVPVKADVCYSLGDDQFFALPSR